VTPIAPKDILKGDLVMRDFPNGVLGMTFAKQTFVASFDGPQGLAGDEAAVYYLINRE
jgi:hypothetical protein